MYKFHNKKSLSEKWQKKFIVQGSAGPFVLLAMSMFRQWVATMQNSGNEI